MKVNVDHGRCQNLGICASLVPLVFELDDDGTMVVADSEPGEDVRGAVQNAVYACPTEALSISD
ncbi:ferredoxin [Rhodococcus sp. ACS1]|uniref:ferredoxin n=1 Tax=Rhodococcus sp. ACS1 TaxID=2028570 RepID=UPI000BB11F6A|nr:ferredoxin [Rhodococcus sp. ACS1]PBC35350.1 ferredoxin [Rhodococcus sp. ACS1]